MNSKLDTESVAVNKDYIPFTGQEYLDSLNDGREVWIYGERVENITEHPAFRNSARMIARMYDALHAPETKDILTTPTEWGGLLIVFFVLPIMLKSKWLHVMRSRHGNVFHGDGWGGRLIIKAVLLEHWG